MEGAVVLKGRCKWEGKKICTAGMMGSGGREFVLAG